MSDLYPSALIGYRAWVLREPGYLCSTMGQVPWRTPTEKASCYFHAHRSPDSDCHCGLYAFHDLEPAETLAASMYFAGIGVTGVIAGRGHAEIHAAGFRVAEARVIALLAPSHRIHFRTQDLLERTAARYEVPIAERDRLIELAAAAGAPAPMSLRPAEGRGYAGL